MEPPNEQRRPTPVSSPVWRIRIDGDIDVCVPNDIQLLTPYVLLEQEDWFEDESAFVRRVLLPGMNVIDIGANCGVYALTAARIAGPRGKVWAFEPSGAATAYLARGIAANRLDNIELIQAGLSNRAGRSALVLNRNTEMCRLSDGETDTRRCEMVDVFTLDACMKRYAWSDIAFVKMDAEGHEGNIIAGGEEFLRTNSPLIMYEIKAGERFSLDLVEAFGARGYESYRLVPGLGVLARFDAGEDLDRYRLNLFCCRRSRAAQLGDRGLLVDGPARRQALRARKSLWMDDLAGRAYARRSIEGWRNYGSSPSMADWEPYAEALDSYARSRDMARSAADRLGCLQRAFDLLLGLVRRTTNISRLQSFVRVASELGERGRAVEALAHVINGLLSGKPAALTEPFLPVSPRYEGIDPGEDPAHWLVSSVVEQHERLRAFSSYYTGADSLESLELLKRLGFQSPEMERRRQLVRMRMNVQSAPERQELLTLESADNRNPGFWSAGRR